MKERLLITTAIGLMLGTGAFAQSPNDQPRTNSPPAAQSQTNSNSSAPAASSSTASTPSSTPSAAQNAQSTPSGTPKSATTTSQSTPNATGNNAPAPSQAQSNQAAPPSQGNGATTAPSQAQSTQPANSPTQAQSNTAPPGNNQSQATGTNANTNAGAQPSTNTAAQPSNNQTNTAQSSSSNVSVSASLNETQRTRVSESIARLNVAPVNNVNFSLSVGAVVPRDVRFQPLPADVVEVMPQYRGYNFFVVRDDIVIVDPSTYKIVDVLPRTGRSTAAAPASHKTTFSDRDREVIRKHARSSRIEQRTTGSSAASTRVRVGERFPDSVEIRSFPDEVYRESPTLREYRYIERDNRTYVVEPRERTIIEEIE